MSTEALDLLSTSQTFLRCDYGAPLVAIVKDGYATIGQSCCNHWDCPHCGQVRAREEYRRIVNGCEVLAASHKLYFWTLTCRGKDCSLEEAEENYYRWTNVLLTNARTKAKRASQYWAYAQITERQKKTRQHPHSHIITTFLPNDAVVTGGKKSRQGYASRWFMLANERAGLGSQNRISLVENPSAASRYVAKYMFKDSMTEEWPPKWKRVRYSENWPKLDKWVADFALPLTGAADWKEIGKMKALWVCEDARAYESARKRIVNIIRANAPLPEYASRAGYTVTQYVTVDA